MDIPLKLMHMYKVFCKSRVFCHMYAENIFNKKEIKTMAKTEKKLSLYEKQQLWYKHFPYFDAEMKLQLINQKKQQIPYLTVNNNTEAYTNLDSGQIVIGLEHFSPYTEQEFLMMNMYVVGHECGHIKHTSNKAWKYAINEGVRRICIKMSEELEGRGRRRFHRASDIDVFIKKVLQERHDLKITKSSLQRFAAGIFNSLEDGRENRRQCKNPTFKSNMLFTLGRVWQEGALSKDMANAADNDKMVRLTIKINQILTLAKMGLYQKDFLKYFENAEIYDEIEGIIPIIHAAVMERSCRRCTEKAIELDELLAIELLEASEKTSLDKLIEELMNEIYSDMNFGDGDDVLSCSGDSDDSGENGFGVGFNVFVAVKEQPDNDGLNSVNSSDDVDNNTGSDNEDQGSFDNHSCDRADSSNGSNSRNVDDKSDDGSDKKSASPDRDSCKNQNETENSSDTSDSSNLESENTEDNDDNAGNESKLTAKTPNAEQSNGKRNTGSCSDDDPISVKELEKIVETAMKQAASAQAGMVETQINQANSEEVKNRQRKTSNSAPVVASNEINQRYSNCQFIEMKRQYELRYNLPAELKHRSNVFSEKIQERLQNERKQLAGLSAGKLNSGSLYKIITGDCNMFYKDSDPDKFDGVCYILQDNSGSMGYGRCSKREYACEAEAVMEAGFSGLMPLKITAFDAYANNRVVHECVKDFDESFDISTAYNFLIQGRSGNGNKDGYSIRIATQELNEREESGKLLVILSDGTPSAYSDYDDGICDVRDAVNEARNFGINVVVICFPDDLDNQQEIDEYRQMYGADIIATTPQEIENELLMAVENFYFE